MKKTKLFEVSLINKAYSRVIRDTTRFYTSDTALEIGFKLAEPEYSFDSGVILLLNDEDQSLVVRDLAREGAGFIYTLEDDIIEHYGNWAAQLKFEKEGETYVSSPVGFTVHNDLYNNRPPKLTDVNTWKNLRSIADGLISDLREELEALEAQELEITTAEAERQSAELSRIENENQRNITSVDEFIKLQDAVGGRNLVPDSDFTTGTGGWLGYYGSLSNVDGEVIKFTPDGTNPSITRMEYPFTIAKAGIYTLTIKVKATVPIWFRNFVNATLSNGEVKDTGNVWTTITTKFTVDTDNASIRCRLYLRNAVAGSTVEFDWFKVEKGEESTPYTKAPEDYTTVSKDDYYNYIKLMNDFKEEQTKLSIDRVGEVRLVNDFENGDFSNGTTNWMTTTGYINRFEVVDGVARNTDVSSTTNQGSFIYNNVKIPSGHVTYHAFRYKQSNISSSTLSILYGLTNSTSQQIEYPTGEDFKAYTGLGVSTGSSVMRFLVTNIVPNGEPSIYLDYFLIVDLTATFGAGNEPSKATMDWIFSKAGYFDKLAIKRDDIQIYELNQLKKAVIALGGTI